MLRSALRRGVVARGAVVGATSMKSMAAAAAATRTTATTTTTTTTTRTIAAAYAAAAGGRSVWARRFSPEFIVSMNKLIKLLAERGEWWFAQAWIPSDDG